MLAIFDDQFRQEEIVEGTWDRINPTNSVQDTRVIEFLVKGNDAFIDLHNCFLITKIKILKADGTNIPAPNIVGIINYPGATLIEQIDLYLNNEQILSTSHYPYKSYLETLLSYGPAAKKTWLGSSLYNKDTHSQMDSALDNNNVGFRKRRAFVSESKSVELFSKIHVDLFNQERMLLNGIDLKLVLRHSTDEFCLMTDDADNYKIKLEDAFLMVRRNRLADHKFNEMQSTIMKQDAKYFIPHVEVKVFTYAAGLRNINVNNFITGRDLPKRIVLAMVSNAAFHGNKTLNPFNFKHYNLTSVNITVDNKSIMGKPQTLNFTTNETLQTYWAMMGSLGYQFRDDGCDITRDEFNHGYTLICADLKSTICSGQYADPSVTGILEIQLGF